MKDRALSLFRMAVREWPDYGGALFEIGMIFEEKGLLGAALNPRSNEQLAELAAMMAENRKIRLVIEGHTDDQPIRGVIEISRGPLPGQ